MGERGLATFLSEPRFEDLPALIETPGPHKQGSDLAEVQRTKTLRATGLDGSAGRGVTRSAGASRARHNRASRAVI